MFEAQPNIPCEFLRLRDRFGWELPGRVDDVGKFWVPETRKGKAHYPESVHDQLQLVEDNSFWFQHRNRIIHSCLNRFATARVLWEVGSGNGVVAGFLRSVNWEVIGIEPSEIGARFSAAKRGVPTICGFLDEIRLPANSIPTIGCFDVIEHLEDPEQVLSQLFRCLAPGGIIIVTVPALSWLWSDVDRFSGHFRRYTRRLLVGLAESAGLESVYTNYFMLPFVIPLFCCRTIPTFVGERMLGYRRSEEKIARQAVAELSAKQSLAIKWLQKMLTWEERSLFDRQFPVGTSLISVWRKAA